LFFGLLSPLKVSERFRLLLKTEKRGRKAAQAVLARAKENRAARKRKQAMGDGLKLSTKTQITRIIQCPKPTAGHQTHRKHQWVSLTSHRLAYNPITLEYDRNPEGERLKRLDEDAKIRGYVRAHNMDHNGNSKYNPLTG
jgi:hypothetical protein